MYKYDKTSYLIKDIPVEKWTSFRTECLSNGKKINDVMISLIDKFVRTSKEKTSINE
tara:strand:- start:578 stop:748 length:171 start_codon:yes stop_codon:yes gene_type:complete